MKVSFKCVNGIHVLHAEYGGAPESQYPKGLITADRTEAWAEEEFEPIQNPDSGRWGFKSSNGFWLSAQSDGKLFANRERPEDWKPEAWESFEVIRHPDGSVSLKTDHGKFVCAEDGGGNAVNANRDAANAWETFKPSSDFMNGTVLPPGVRPENPVGRVVVGGRFWNTQNGTFRPRFASMLSILRRSDDEIRQLLNWVDGTGFNGIRVFAGNLSWAGQSAQMARDRLPFLLEECKARGLYVEVTALTDTGAFAPGEERRHVELVANICRFYDNTLLEVANEYWHPTQSPWTHDANNLLASFQDYAGGVTTALGAPATDEPPLPGPYANYITLHLDRGRDPHNMVRRVRELEAASATYGKPVLNNEPIGAGENYQPGRRLNDPAIFFTMGALNRVFEVGGVHHSQHGLDAVMPGPVQNACAQHFIRGYFAVKTDDRLQFWNATWAGSPIRNADFNQVIRAYSGTWGNNGVTVLVGLRGDPRLEFGNGWHSDGVIDQVSGCQILSISR